MKTHAAVIALATATLWSGAAQAQQTAGVEEPEALPEVVAEGDEVAPPVELGSGVDSGVTRIERQDIEIRSPGSGDVNELLRILPTAQFDRNRGIATRESIQDIRPAQISISGGHYYDNNFTVDGIGVNSRLDVTNDNPQSLFELAGPSAQALWVDSELVGSVTVLDSNISAEYGEFTGGSVDIQTRDPRRILGVTATVSHSNDGLSHYKISKAARDAFEEAGRELPQQPEFDKWRYGATIDLPVSQDASLLLGYNRSEAWVINYAGANYGGGARQFRSISDNVLVKGLLDITPDTKLTGQFVYSPYSSTSSTPVAVNSTVDSHGGGITAKLGLEHEGDVSWKLSGAFSHSDTGREAEQFHYSIDSGTGAGDFCDSRNCSTGGIGDFDQSQNSYVLDASFDAFLGSHLQLRGGIDYEHLDAANTRPEEARMYSRADVDPDIVCVGDQGLACETGSYALTQYNVYPEHDIDIALDSVGVWTEALLRIDALTLRGGVRYDYESFLGNHVFAPRLAASYRVPGSDVEISLGANRYYGRSMVTYAIREQVPDWSLWRRNGTATDGTLQYSDDDWYLYRVTSAVGYRDSDLDTPYSDELTAAVSGKVLGGTARLKGILRNGENEFARSPRRDDVVDNGDGTGTTYRFYEMTNAGTTRYRGVSLEWSRSFGRHAVVLSANYSKTKRTNPDYTANVDNVLFEDEPVLYQGEQYTTFDIRDMNQALNFASPILANATWSSSWLDARLKTNLSVHYRGSFDRIEDTGINEVIDGIRHDVYDLAHYPDSIDVDLNAQAEVVRSRYGTLILDARVTNLLDTVPATDYISTSNPYQLGRSAWVGAKFRF
ncbi:TonB-dependent receptor plug domain-containing protein [Alteriqipengyuania sp. 357]